MKYNIFEYLSYRKYLRDRLEALGPRSGLKRKAADFLNVHTTFISQVVLEKADFSLDQCELMNQFLKHNEEESEFFIDLQIYERAGEKNLKKRFERKIKEKQVARSQIKRSLTSATISELSANDQDKFYSSYIYGLIHVLVSIPNFRTEEKLIEATGMPHKIISEAIDFLLKIGVIKKQGHQLVHGPQHVHLNKGSKNIWRHHANWRMATLQKYDFGEPTDLHYSLAFSCSEQDAHTIRELILTQLETINKKITSSKEESAYIYCFDFYKW